MYIYMYIAGNFICLETYNFIIRALILKQQVSKLAFFAADRAKQIKTVAIVNEDPTEKLIRELRQENERLKRMLDKGAMDVPIQPGMSEEGEPKILSYI